MVVEVIEEGLVVNNGVGLVRMVGEGMGEVEGEGMVS